MITSESNKAGPYTCDGVTTEFPFFFPIFAKTDIRVFLLDIDNLEIELDYITDFIVTAENDDFTTGGTVITSEVYDDSTLTILRDVDITQESDYVENETFPADTFERDRDKLVMMVQQLVELTSRMLRTAITDEAVSLELPRVADRISRFLAFDTTGKPIAAKTITGVPVTGFMETLLDDETAEAGRTTLDVYAKDETYNQDEVYTQDEIKQLRYLRHKGRHQNYAGNNGTGQGAEIFNKTTDVSATWDQYAHGKGDYAFKGGVYDGKYVWMFPAYSDDLIRINPATGTFESFAHGKGDYAYYGGCFDGTYIWMAPFLGDSLTRVNPEDGSMTHYAHSYGTAAFAGAVFDGRYVWLIPEESNTLVRVDPEDGSMSNPTGVNISTIYAAIAFNGGCFDGTYIWMCPYEAGYLVRLNPVTNVLTNYDVTGQYEGIIFDGTYIWLFPAGSRYIAKFNPETEEFEYIATGETSGNSFSYGCFDGISLWLAPNDCSTIFKLNPKDNSIVKFTHGLGATGVFAGAVFDGESVWMVPFQSDDIVRIRPPEFGKPGIHSTGDLFIGGNVKIKGVILSGVKNVTSSSDALDVMGVSVISFDVSAGDIVIGGLANGVIDQRIEFYKISASGHTLTFIYNSATGTQKIVTPPNTNIVWTNRGGGVLKFDGIFWHLMYYSNA
jgi:streptogramin lyase